ncbi:hypothetical protein Tco_0930884 [Tanacetum coccineum]
MITIARTIKRLRQRIQELELLHHEESTKSDHTWQPYEDENTFGKYHPEVRGGYRDDPLRGIRMKVEIPEFLGKVKLVAIRLQKHASLWWDHVKMQRALAGKSKVVTWEKMKNS